MKFSAIFLASLVSCDEKKVPPRHPLQRLSRLVEFSGEILHSSAFSFKNRGWVSKWHLKFITNANRMEKNFNRRCGFYDPTL